MLSGSALSFPCGRCYSGNDKLPLTLKVVVTVWMPVLGWPPPTETLYWPWDTMGSPASVTMLRVASRLQVRSGPSALSRLQDARA